MFGTCLEVTYRVKLGDDLADNDLADGDLPADEPLPDDERLSLP